MHLARGQLLALPRAVREALGMLSIGAEALVVAPLEDRLGAREVPRAECLKVVDRARPPHFIHSYAKFLRFTHCDIHLTTLTSNQQNVFLKQLRILVYAAGLR